MAQDPYVEAVALVAVAQNRDLLLDDNADAALEKLYEALALYQSTGNQYSEGWTLRRIGWVLWSIGDIEGALTTTTMITGHPPGV